MTKKTKGVLLHCPASPTHIRLTKYQAAQIARYAEHPSLIYDELLRFFAYETCPFTEEQVRGACLKAIAGANRRLVDIESDLDFEVINFCALGNWDVENRDPGINRAYTAIQKKMGFVVVPCEGV